MIDKPLLPTPKTIPLDEWAAVMAEREQELRDCNAMYGEFAFEEWGKSFVHLSSETNFDSIADAERALMAFMRQNSALVYYWKVTTLWRKYHQGHYVYRLHLWLWLRGA